jgi:tetratricopeptide (TPR) repeat protein
MRPEAVIAQAAALFHQGRMTEAEQQLCQLATAQQPALQALQALAEFYLACQRFADAEQTLSRMLQTHPGHPDGYLQLGALLERGRRWRDMAALYQRMTVALPRMAVAHFNCAVYTARSGEPEKALASYQQALALGIDAPEEVFNNIASIHTRMNRDTQARAALEQALAINPDYIPALYNFGLLHEEFGEREQAIALFQRILVLDPQYHEALVRIAHARPALSPDDPLPTELERALRKPGLTASERENLHFALAKLFDDCGRHEQAFAHYRLGNESSKARLSPYRHAASEAETGQIIGLFNKDWLQRVQPVSEQPLLFICGMFRSGSTLAEQILAAHSAVSAGGEINFFNEKLRLAASPPAIADPVADREALQRLGNSYLELLRQRFPGAALVSNKRPDNFVFLGLIKALFPNARFVHTMRDERDTCLSIWFQQLEDGLGYAAELESIVHYQRQYRRLMAHWKSLFPESIFDLEYERLIVEPEAVTRALLAFLQLPWQDACLRFAGTGNRVRTASLWQVRKPLYRDSAGRWRNYQPFLGTVFDPLDREIDGRNPP